jgi:IS30 family transposase
MAPPLTKEQLEILNTEFYTNMNFFGRDKLYNILRQKYPDKAISRRQIAEWLATHEVNQLYHPSKGKAKDIKSSMTTPNTILAIDLVDLQKIEIRGFKYLFNGIDMGSRYVYSVAMKNKTDTEVLKAFKKIYQQFKIRAIRSDNGSEFINNKFKNF